MPPAARGSQKVAAKSVNQHFFQSRTYLGVRKRPKRVCTHLSDHESLMQTLDDTEGGVFSVGNLGRRLQNLMVDISCQRALRVVVAATYQQSHPSPKSTHACLRRLGGRRKWLNKASVSVVPKLHEFGCKERVRTLSYSPQ